MEIYGNRKKEKCCNVKVSANYSSVTTNKENIMESTTDMPISLDTNTPLKTSSDSLCIRDLENFMDSQVYFVLKKKARGGEQPSDMSTVVSESEGTYCMPGGYYFTSQRGIKL